MQRDIDRNEPIDGTEHGRRAMGESVLTRQLGAPLRGAPSCYVQASSCIVRRPSGGGPERALKGL
eukprot:12497545-Alexandrium_andersonii.AAC.1